MAANEHFGHQCRHRDDNQGDEIQRDEQSAAVRPGQIAEFPYIGDAGFSAYRNDQEE
jgi:hypothetical protein